MKLTFFSPPVTCKTKQECYTPVLEPHQKITGYMWKCNTPFLFPLLLFSSSCFTLPQLKSLAGFTSWRTKFVPRPSSRREVARHRMAVRKPHPPAPGELGSCSALSLRVQSVHFCLQTDAVLGCWLPPVVPAGSLMWKPRVFTFAQTLQEMEALTIPLLCGYLSTATCSCCSPRFHS